MPLAAHALFHAALALAALLQQPANTAVPSSPQPPTTATAQPTSRPSPPPTSRSSPAGAAPTVRPSVPAPSRAAATPRPSVTASTAAGTMASPPAASGPRAPAWLAPLGRLDPSVLAAIALLALAAALFTLVFAVITWLRARRMTRHYQSLMRGVEGQSLMRAVESYVERLNAVERRAGQVGEHGRATSTRLQSAIQHVRLERYSAVDANDNQQSFSLALLDAADNGIVLSAIYTRSGLRVYAKPIAAGQSSYALSPEERRAIGGG